MCDCLKLILRIIATIIIPAVMIGFIIWSFVGLIQFMIGYARQGKATVYWESNDIDPDQSQGFKTFLYAWGIAGTILLILVVIRSVIIFFPSYQFSKLECECILNHIDCIKSVGFFFGIVSYFFQAVYTLSLMIGATLLSTGISQNNYTIKLGKDPNKPQSIGLFALLISACSFLIYVIFNEGYILVLEVSGSKKLMELVPQNSNCCCIRCLQKINQVIPI